MPETVKRFEVGAIDCVAISDDTTSHTMNTSNLRPTMSVEELQAALQPWGEKPGEVRAGQTCLLVETGGKRVLVDTGNGPNAGPGRGMLIEHLRRLGIAPEQIDTVVITHAHGDHVAGVLTAEGGPAFPRAEFVFGKPELAFLTQQAQQSNARGDLYTKWLAVVQPRLRLVSEGDAIADGVTAIDAPGHSPGQITVAVASQGQRLFFVGDLVHFLVQALHPDWCTTWDRDVQQAPVSRREVFTRAVREGALVMASHFPFPSVGRVVPQGDGWMWRPL